MEKIKEKAMLMKVVEDRPLFYNHLTPIHGKWLIAIKTPICRRNEMIGQTFIAAAVNEHVDYDGYKGKIKDIYKRGSQEYIEASNLICQNPNCYYNPCDSKYKTIIKLEKLHYVPADQLEYKLNSYEYMLDDFKKSEFWMETFMHSRANFCYLEK